MHLVGRAPAERSNRSIVEVLTRRTVLLAIALGATALAAACGGRQTAGESPPATGSKPEGPRVAPAGTSPSPCPRGRCQVAVTVVDVQGRAVVSADVRYEARHTGMNRGTVSATADHRGGGCYEGTVNFSMSGDWNVGL